MKRYLSAITISALMLFIANGVSAGKKIFLFESFENSVLDGWTQEYVSGSTRWVLESGDVEFPDGTIDGYKRIALRNNTNMTQRFVTRLVSPAMDLSKAKDIVVLTFSHAQAQWIGDFDTLRVMYKADSVSEWAMLKEYTEVISDWHADTISLPNLSEVYRIAFVGTDNIGRGIVIDNVKVQTLKTALKPKRTKAKK